MKFIYVLITLMLTVALQPLFAQQPANKPQQPSTKQQTATSAKQTSAQPGQQASQNKQSGTGIQSKPATTNTNSGNTTSSKQASSQPQQQGAPNKQSGTNIPSKPTNSNNTTVTKPANHQTTPQTGKPATNLASPAAKPSPNAKASTSYTAVKEEQAVELAIIGDTAGVVLHADPRLAMITYNTRHDGQVINGRKTGSIYSARGFRVQIYSGSDRSVATQRKVDFIRRYPGVRTYMTYIAPTFRVKVGDYRERKSAQNMYQQVSKLYNPCMVVNDIIEVNTFRND